MWSNLFDETGMEEGLFHGTFAACSMTLLSKCKWVHSTPFNREGKKLDLVNASSLQEC